MYLIGGVARRGDGEQEQSGVVDNPDHKGSNQEAPHNRALVAYLAAYQKLESHAEGTADCREEHRHRACLCLRRKSKHHRERRDPGRLGTKNNLSVKKGPGKVHAANQKKIAAAEKLSGEKREF